jgi:hypothetical protein
MTPDFLEKWAKAIWSSPASAKLHARKHAGEMFLTPEKYLSLAERLFETQDSLKQVKDKKWGGGAKVLWDRKTGNKLVIGSDGKIVTLFNAGVRP